MTSNDHDAAIRARALVRDFDDQHAVAGVDLEVGRGEVYGFLGPNGAGKSTTVRMLCTLLSPTSGEASVAGFDVVKHPGQVRLRIGVALQEAALDPRQTGRELLRLQGRLYGLSARDVHFVPVPFPALGQALKRHLIDVAWLPEPTASANGETMGLAELTDLDQGATEGFPVGWYVATKAWAKKYPRTLEAFLGALRQGQEIADSSRTAVEQAMEKLPAPFTVSPTIAAVMSIENYPLNVAPNIDLQRVQRVANEMLQFHMLKTKFEVSSMLGGA